MLFSYTLAATLATFTLSLAAPANLVRTFSINQVSKGKELKNGPLDVVRTYQKYGKTPPSHVVAAAAAVQSGSVAANPEAYDEAYNCPVTVGANTMNLDFDTGSADLWVFSTLTPTSQSTGHNIYNPSSSSSSKRLTGQTWNIQYGDGSGASGVVYADKVVVGGVTATSQAVEAATSASSQFTNNKATDGLLGLAFSSLNTVSPTKQNTFFDTVKSTLPQSLFTATLKHGQAGSYDFGYIDSSKYKNTINYAPVSTANGFWEFQAARYAVGSNPYSTSTIGDAILDTGTTLLYIPDGVLSAYYSKVPGAQNSATYGGYVFPCNSTLPTLSIGINGVPYTIPGAYLNYAPVTASTCYGGVQSSDGIGFNIFGDVFIKSVFVVFDQTQSSPRLGFASRQLS